MKYHLIYADPPWKYRDKANAGNRGASHKYPVMTLQDLKRLPVWDLADDQCLLAMWHVPTMPIEAIQLCEAWGFRMMTMKGFTWHKIHSKSGKSCMGMGHLTRGNSEDMLFGVKGKLLPRFDAGIIQHVTAPRGRHSEKPAIFRHLLTELVGEVDRIELFARETAAGWDSWGNECEIDVELSPAHFKTTLKTSAA